jgi:hypothetical protein
MKSKTIGWTVRIIAVLTLAAGSGALAQTSNHVEFRGVINDFTPASAPVNGPWEVRGPWSLTVNRRSDKANFSAALTMERSDLGVTENAGPAPTTPSNPLDNPMLRMAHTHHITLVGGRVTRITNGFQVTGYATITKDGAFPPPFGPTLPLLTLTITGVPPTASEESTITFSNITLLFGAPAAGHFGSNPLHGVVRTSDTGGQDQHR